jgi:heme-degrading monooxygenase HmoA
MIVRIWRGWAALANAVDYPAHFRRRVLPELRATEGFLEAKLLRRDLTDRIEFMVMTRWQSLDAIRAFAGAALDRAVVEPGALAALEAFDETVLHYQVIDSSGD